MKQSEKAIKVFNEIQKEYNLSLEVERVDHNGRCPSGAIMTQITSYDDEDAEFIFEYSSKSGINCYDSIGNRYDLIDEEGFSKY